MLNQQGLSVDSMPIETSNYNLPWKISTDLVEAANLLASIVGGVNTVRVSAGGGTRATNYRTHDRALAIGT